MELRGQSSPVLRAGAGLNTQTTAAAGPNSSTPNCCGTPAMDMRCREHLREADTMGRWGGEEFVVTLPETAYEQSLDVAAALCRHVAARPLLDGHRITISCGVTSARPGDDTGSLLRRADTALYAAKHAGRNCAQGIIRDEMPGNSARRGGAYA